MQKTPVIAILAYSNAQKAAIYGLTDLLETAAKFQLEDKKRQEFTVCQLEEPDEEQYLAIIIPPSLGPQQSQQSRAALVTWLTRQHQQGAIICSVCAGAFLLAQTGLLKNRAATTHWALSEKFTQNFPDVLLDSDKLLIDEGDIMTAGGLMAWVDLGLRLVDRFIGTSIMQQTARYFLVDPGGREQRFYRTFSPALQHGDQAILGVQHWLQKHSNTKFTMASLAGKINLTERTFLRRFFKATKLNPSEYLQFLRVGKARSLMESSTLSVDEIAWQVGYQDSSAFRRIFHKTMGLTPREYRKRFMP
ncbi:MAG: helix-turn-helix domain-containing protein [Oceanospirillaceae bacterium]